MANIHTLPSLRIDLKQNYVVEAVCKQLDSIVLEFILYDGCVSADISNFNVELRALKRDKVPLIQDIDIITIGNIVKIKANEQLTTTSGTVKCELLFISKTTKEKKYSFNIELKIIPSVLEVDRSISKATCTLLERLENNLDEAIGVVSKIDKVKNEASQIESDLITAKTQATSVDKNLVTNIEIANKVNDTLDSTNNNAIRTNTNLTKTNNTATEDIEILTNRNNTAQILDESLQNKINKGQTLDNNLGIKISTGTELNANLKTTLTDGIKLNSNLDTIVPQANEINNKLKITNTSATETKNELDNENILANKKIEIMRNLDPSGVVEDLGNFKKEVTSARGIYPNLNTRIDNIQARDGTNVYLTDTHPIKDGIWFDTSDNMEQVEGNSVIKEIKSYIDNGVKIEVNENAKKIGQVNSQLSNCAKKDGTLQSNLNSEKIEGKTINDITHFEGAFSDGGNLNDYRSIGQRYKILDSTKLINCPSNINNSELQIYGDSAGACRQIIYSSGEQIVTRTYQVWRNPQWSEWKQLATVDDTGWINLPLISPAISWDSSATPKYRKINNIVEIRGAIKGLQGISPQSGFTFSNLPVGFRPNQTIGSVCQGSRLSRWYLTVSAYGGLNVDRYSENGTTLKTQFDGSEWLPFQIMFRVD